MHIKKAKREGTTPADICMHWHADRSKAVHCWARCNCIYPIGGARVMCDAENVMLRSQHMCTREQGCKAVASSQTCVRTVPSALVPVNVCVPSALESNTSILCLSSTIFDVLLEQGSLIWQSLANLQY